MEIIKVVKPFIRRGANTFGNIVYLFCFLTMDIIALCRSLLQKMAAGEHQADKLLLEYSQEEEEEEDHNRSTAGLLVAGESVSRGSMALYRLFFFICAVNVSCAQIYSALYDEKTSRLFLREGLQPDSVAVANFTDHINNTG